MRSPLPGSTAWKTGQAIPQSLLRWVSLALLMLLVNWSPISAFYNLHSISAADNSAGNALVPQLSEVMLATGLTLCCVVSSTALTALPILGSFGIVLFQLISVVAAAPASRFTSPPHAAFGPPAGFTRNRLTPEDLGVQDVTQLHRRWLENSNAPVCVSSTSFPPPDDGVGFAEGFTQADFFFNSGAGPSADGGSFETGWLFTPTYQAFVTISHFTADLKLAWTKAISKGSYYAAESYTINIPSVVGSDVVFPSVANFTTLANGGDVLVAKFDESGTMHWATVFGGPGDDEGDQITRLSTGDVIVTGTSSLFYQPYGVTAPGGFIARLDPNGVLLWVTPVSLGTFGVAVYQDDVYVSGYDATQVQQGVPISGFFSKFDSSDGSLMWMKTVSVPGLNMIFGYLAVSSAGLFSLAATVQSSSTSEGVGPYVFLFNSTGDLQWAQILPAPHAADLFISTAFAPDGTIVAAGYTESHASGGNEDILCARFSLEGDLLWVFTAGGKDNDIAYVAHFTNDDGVILSGFTASYGIGRINGMYVKVDSYLEAPLHLGVMTVTDWTQSWTVIPCLTCNPVAVPPADLGSFAYPLPLSAPYFYHNSLPTTTVDMPPTLTWLTYPLIQSGFPVVESALEEFPWSFQIPSQMYTHLNVPVVVGLSTNATWLTLDPNTLLLSGVPTVADSGVYEIRIQTSANIPGIGFPPFPDIVLTLCLDSATPHGLTVVSYEKAFSDLIPTMSAIVVHPNGELTAMGTMAFALSAATFGIVSHFSASRETLWVMFLQYPDVGTSSADQSYVNDGVLASNGNMVVVGYTTVGTVGREDVIITSILPNGTSLWSFTFGSTGSDVGTGVAMLENGTIYVTGYTNSFGSGADDAFLACVLPNGTLLWMSTYGGPGVDTPASLVLTTSGHLAVGGATTPVGQSSSDILVFTATLSGDVVWSYSFGGSGSDSVSELSPGSGGSLYLTGSTTSAGAGGADLLVGSLDPSGSVLWLSTLGGTGADTGSGIAVNAAGTSIFVSGATDSVGYGRSDILTAAFDGSGNLEWATDAGGPNVEFGQQIYQQTNGDILSLTSFQTFGFGPACWMLSDSQGVLSPNYAAGFGFVTTQLSSSSWAVGAPSAPFGFTSASASPTSTVYSLTLTEVLSTSAPTAIDMVFFLPGLLPAPVTQVPFGKVFQFNAYSSISTLAAFSSLTAEGSPLLPSWLSLDRASGNVTGTPLNSVRGFYPLVLNVSVSATSLSQTVTFVLNVTNTAPFYDGPALYTTGLGNFQFSLREHVFDAEGDAVGDYVLAPLDGMLPKAIATLNIGTGQLEGAALAGSAGLYSYNITMRDSFGAVGWAVVNLKVNAPSVVFVLLEKLLPVLLPAAGILLVLFALWHRDHASSRSTYYVSELASRFSLAPLGGEHAHGVTLEEVIHTRKTLTLYARKVETDVFQGEELTQQVHLFNNQLFSLSRQWSNDSDVADAVGLYKTVNTMLGVAWNRFLATPLEDDDSSIVLKHERTLLILTAVMELMECVMMVFGSQLHSTSYPPPLSFTQNIMRRVSSLLLSICLPCRRQGGNYQSSLPKVSIKHSSRKKLLMEISDTTSAMSGIIDANMEFFGTGLVGRKRSLLEVQMYHTLVCLKQCVMYLPDSATAADLLLEAFTHVVEPAVLFAQLKDVVQVPQAWFSVLLSTRMAFLSLPSSSRRGEDLTDLQRNLYERCVATNAVGHPYFIADWQLLFGIVILFGEVLKAKILLPAEEAQIRGDGFASTAVQGRLTLQVIASHAKHSCFTSHFRWIREAAQNVLEQTDPSQPLTTNGDVMSKKSVTLRRLPAVSSFQMTGAQKSMRKLPFLRTPSAAALVSSPTTFVSPTKVTIVHPSNLAIAEDAELIEDELIE